MATTTSTFAQAGAVFNDAIRRLEGGLWENVRGEAGKNLGSTSAVVGDLQNVQLPLRAQVPAEKCNGPGLTQVRNVLVSPGKAVNTATAAVSGGVDRSVMAAEAVQRSTTLRASISIGCGF